MPITGAGNPTGGTAGVGKGLNYIGIHCFAYSGNVVNAGTSGADTTLFNFTTGSGYIVGQFQWEADNEGTYTTDITIEINGEMIYDSEFDVSPSRGMWLTPLDVILPAYSLVVMKFGASASLTSAAQFTGRVYE